MRFKLIFSYDGSRYKGMQYQPNLPTIEGEFIKALKKLNNGIDTKFIFASRTDKGVHAKNAVAHIDLDINIKPIGIKRALNSLLPEDIYLDKVIKVNEEFHARYNKCIKTYKYYLTTDNYSPFNRLYKYHYSREIDLKLLKKYIKYFIGKHNFYFFASPSDPKNSYIREIYSAGVTKKGNDYIFTFKGDGFLKYQVRNMIGTLLKLMDNKITEEDFFNLLTENGDFNKVNTAPPNGLYLDNIKYL